MTVLRRLAFAASIVLCALLAVTAAGSAAGFATAGGGKGGGPLPPGEYRFQTTRANVHLQGSLGTAVDVFATRNFNVFAPDSGPRSVTDETDVFVQTQSQGSFASACFVVSASDLSVRTDLQTASLHTKLTSATPSCYPGTPNVPLPLSLDLTWKGSAWSRPDKTRTAQNARTSRPTSPPSRWTAMRQHLQLWAV